jgi:hypothetical protein
MTDDPVQEQYREKLNALARGLDDFLNGDRQPGDLKKLGFALFMFEFGAGPGRINYISNASRDDMLVAVREWLARAEGRVVEPGGKQ